MTSSGVNNVHSTCTLSPREITRECNTEKKSIRPNTQWLSLCSNFSMAISSKEACCYVWIKESCQLSAPGCRKLQNNTLILPHLLFMTPFITPLTIFYSWLSVLRKLPVMYTQLLLLIFSICSIEASIIVFHRLSTSSLFYSGFSLFIYQIALIG